MQPKTDEAAGSADPKARFLFVAPRFHTNQIPVVRALLERGHPVRFLVRYVGPVESHALIQPELTALRRPWVKRARALEQTQWQVPLVLPLWRLVRDYDPQVTIIREGNALTDWVVATLLLLRGKRFLLYTQAAKHRKQFPRLVRLGARVLVDWLGNGWFTPVLYREGPQSCELAAMDFLPLVWVPDPGLRKDWSTVPAEGPVRLLSIGKYARYKNHPLLLQAVAAPTVRERVRLTLIGECSSEEHWAEYAKCRELVATLDLQGLVELRMSTPYEAIQQEYRKHDVLVLSSNRESCAMVILEAMGYGVPPVSGDYNGSACYIEHGRTGFIYRSGNLEHLTRTLEQVIRRRSELPTIGRLAAEAIAQRCSPETYYETLRGILRKRCGVIL
jgi:glycosyltransferase involved in cell wall biosynthesis